MNNSEYLQELAERGDGSLQAWFDSEHVPNDDLGAKNDVSSDDDDVTPRTCDVDGYGSIGTICEQVIYDDADDLRADSREKLESEFNNMLHDLVANAHRSCDAVVTWDNKPFFDLLDRQATITERHWMEICGASASANVELSKKITELQAELAKRDKGIERLKARRDELTAKVDNLTAENLKLAQIIGDTRAQVDIYRDAIGQMLDVADELHRIAKAHER